MGRAYARLTCTGPFLVAPKIFGGTSHMNRCHILFSIALALLTSSLAPATNAQGRACKFKGFPLKVCASANTVSSLRVKSDLVGPFTVVADGLESPRGLAFGPGGRLYVAQAGEGGGSATGKITEIRYPWQP